LDHRTARFILIRLISVPDACGLAGACANEFARSNGC